MTAPASVGIDNINLYTSSIAVDFAEIAAARDALSARDLHTTSFRRRSVVPSYEDPITLAVNAAKPLVEKAGRDAFELLVVATETGLDYEKPLSAYAHKHLNLGARCRNFETKHACYSGTAALQMATSWVRSGVAPGKQALIIMTDISRRHFGLLGELVLGTGAVALSVSAEPSLLALDPWSGYASQEVFDVIRPTATTEWADPVLSLCSYLDLLELSWQAYQQAAGPIDFESHFDYMLYHTPLRSLVKQAHQLLLESHSTSITLADMEASFDRMVAPGFGYIQETGNIYSGNLYAVLAGLLHYAPDLAPGKRVGFYSYGAGACAELFSGIVVEGARNVVMQHRIEERLNARRGVSVPEYEAMEWMTERNLSEACFEPDRATPTGHYEQAYQGHDLLVLEGVENYQRSYRWA